jgi:hypothetical protein
VVNIKHKVFAAVVLAAGTVAAIYAPHFKFAEDALLLGRHVVLPFG